MASNFKTGVLLVNLGTPDTPETGDVRRYLQQFLMDWRVIDIPYLNRFFLINGIIAPFRAPKSAKVYKELWNERGSSLKYYTEDLRQLVADELGSDFVVEYAMRYQNPSIESGLKKLKKALPNKIIVLPLFPQYASASTGSVYEEVMNKIKDWQVIPELVVINSFWNHPAYINTFAQLGRKYMDTSKYDHILLTYHGLPERQMVKAHDGSTCEAEGCRHAITNRNKHCYLAQCYGTSRLLAKALNLTPEQYTVSFQSRLGKTPWIKPYTDDVIKTFSSQGFKSVLAFSPAFVADCLETTIEVGVEYRDLFKEHGGETWQLVESLNVHPNWVQGVADMVRVYNVSLPVLEA